MPLKSVHVVTNGKISFFFYDQIIVRCVRALHHLYPPIWRWTFTLFLCLTLNNAVVNMWLHISFELVFLSSLDKYPKLELLDHRVVIFLIF